MKLPIEKVERDRYIDVDDLKPMNLSKRLHVIPFDVGLGKSVLVLDAKHGFMDYLKANVGTTWPPMTWRSSRSRGCSRTTRARSCASSTWTRSRDVSIFAWNSMSEDRGVGEPAWYERP